MKILFMTNVPSRYRVDFFNELGKYLDLTVIFENENSRIRSSSWKSNSFINFKAIFMKGIRYSAAQSISLDGVFHLQKNKYDLVIVGEYSSPASMITMLYMKLKKIPFMISTDGGFIAIGESYIKKWIKTYFISLANAWLSTSDESSKYLCYYGADISKIYKYPFSSIRNDDIAKKCLTKQEKVELKEKLGVHYKTVFVSVGQFVHRKGYDLLIEAASRLNSSIGVYIIGGEPTEEYIALKDKYKADNVHFVGFLNKDRLANYYKLADAFVLPTREDIWGLVINEAMAFGLPVVTTNRCLAGVEVLDNETGIIVDIENVDDLTQALITLSEKNFSETKILEKAQNYTIETMAESHVSIIEKWLHLHKE